MPSYKWDFNSCAIRDGFCKSNHICCKVIKHIICYSIYAHLEENKILTDVQHGYCKEGYVKLRTVDEFAQILNSTSGQACRCYLT